MNRLLCALSLIPAFSSCRPEPNGATNLEILRVYENQIEGSEAVTVERLNLEGFVTPTDSIQFDSLAKVEFAEEERTTGGRLNDDGTITPDPVETVYLITLHLGESNREGLAEFTKKAHGHRVLMRIGDTPLLAPVVQFPIDVPSLQITLSDREEASDLYSELEALVQ